MLATRNYIKFVKENNTEKRYIKRSTNFLGTEQAYLGYLELEFKKPVGKMVGGCLKL
jgi:hypothetical protein